MIRSLRFSLTIWYAFLLSVILAAFAVLLYFHVSRNTEEDLNRMLWVEADAISDNLFSFWRAKEPGPSTELPEDAFVAALMDLFNQRLDEEGLASLVAEWAAQTEELNARVPVQIVDRRSRVAVTSASFLRLGVPLSSKALEQALRGETAYETFETPQDKIRVITRPIVAADRLLYVVRVAASLKQVTASAARLKLGLALLVPLVVLVGSLIGWTMVGRALQPVRKMALQAEQLSARSLNERISIPMTADELKILAETLNRMLERLENSFKRQRQFSAAASHELRTALTAMKGELELSLHRPREAAEYKGTLETQRLLVNDLIGVTTQLLLLARSWDQPGAVERSSVDMKALLDEAVRFFSAAAAQRNVRIEYSPWEGVYVPGERYLLKSLFVNLIANALRYAPESGWVRVSAIVRGDEVQIGVEDNGPGIAAAEIPALFDKFFSQEPSAVPESTGLGLGLCRWIAEAHQGRIEVASPPGKGALFTVILPLQISR